VRHDDERGAVTAFFVVIALALFVMAGFVVDGGRAITARTAAEEDAAQAARAGAEQLSLDAVRQGTISVDPESATLATRHFLSELGRSGEVSVSNSTVGVTVDVVEPTLILGVVGIRNFRFAVHAAATNVHGVASAE